ncbi:hypothetical protein AMTRI_Chr11g98160 [Amborella trichopoda]
MKNQSGFGWNEEIHMIIINEYLRDDYLCIKSFEYRKELSIIVGNDLDEGTVARTTTQLKKEMKYDVEEVGDTVVGLNDDDGVEEVGSNEGLPKTPIQSQTNGMTTNPLEKQSSIKPPKKINKSWLKL